jgi:hypothetical protein
MRAGLKDRWQTERHFESVHAEALQYHAHRSTPCLSCKANPLESDSIMRVKLQDLQRHFESGHAEVLLYHGDRNTPCLA